MPSKYPIYTDPIKTPFIKFFNDCLYTFSCDYNLRRFSERIEEFVSENNLRMKIKYTTEIDLTDYFAVALYRQIEKRIFHVVRGEEIGQWQKWVGEPVTKNS